jgi:hypothetical protein
MVLAAAMANVCDNLADCQKLTTKIPGQTREWRHLDTTTGTPDLSGSKKRRIIQFEEFWPPPHPPETPFTGGLCRIDFHEAAALFINYPPQHLTRYDCGVKTNRNQRRATHCAVARQAGPFLLAKTSHRGADCVQPSRSVHRKETLWK